MRKQIRSSADGPARQSEWDLEALMERLEGDQEFLRELLAIFREDVRVNLEKSHAAIGIGDYEQLSRAAHTMKGMLRNLSMEAAGETAAALETACRESREGESKELLQKLKKELEIILPEVEEQLAGVRS
jgi:HPt (histidine-containing phosphotransfer) domain-containing protein